MLTGLPPFWSFLGVEDTVYQVTHWRTSLAIPEWLSDAARSLLSQVLTAPEARLSFEAIRDHEFFRPLDWDAVTTRQAAAPWSPADMLTGDEDTRYFDSLDQGEWDYDAYVKTAGL